MKIVFFGTTEFSASILETLSKDFEIAAVVTQADKPVGRKQEIQESPVSALAKKLGLPAEKPVTLKDSEFTQRIKDYKPDLFVVIAYGKIIPQEILDIPTKGSINIHFSLLPKYRGASPIHAALLNGETESGVTIMLMDEKMDHGPILAMEKVSVDPEEMFEDFGNKLLDLANKMIVPTIQNFLNGKIVPKEQNHEEATFCNIISKEDGEIDWNKPAQEIFNMYRAYSKWPGVWTSWNGEKIKLTAISATSENAELEPGSVFQKDGEILVQTNKGSIKISQLQQEGKKNMPIEDFLRGHQDFTNAKLS